MKILIRGILFFSLLSIMGQESGGNSRQSDEILYGEYCSSCHGLEGKGDGEFAYLVYPKPRDFSTGTFKIRSTLNGTPPTDGDLFRTIQKGMPGSPMPSFYFLKDEEIRSLVNYIKKIGRIDNSQVQPISIPEILPSSPDLMDLGKTVYQETGCGKCHGDFGKGDGPSAKSLVDTWGYPIVPKDFTSGVYLGGGDAIDLYYRFVGGLDGTPMPSYGNLSDALGRPPEEENKLVWGLVHYLKSLETSPGKDMAPEPPGGNILAKKVKSSIREKDFLEFSTPAWEKAEKYSIPISRLWQSDNINHQVLNVQSIYNPKYIAIKVEWTDGMPDQNITRNQDFQDGAALQFSLDRTMGFHGMGSKDHPTDIWYWKSEWELRQDEEMSSDITLAYGNRAVDSDVATYPTVMNDMAFLPGRDAGNILSAFQVRTVVENSLAVGPQTLTPKKKGKQAVRGRGRWDGNQWQVIFVRPLRIPLKNTVKFEIGKSLPIGFAVWNGSEGDRNGQKMVSTWYTLKLEK